MRLDRFLSHALNISRKDAHQYIRAGQVKVEHQVIKNAALNLAENSAITLNDQLVELKKPLYLMLHKPKGYVCANSDSEHPTVLDLLPKQITQAYKDIQIVGRLDLDTTGLIFITTDGQWNHRVTSPRSDCSKTYITKLAEPILDEHIQSLEAGIILRNDAKPTLPCTIKKLSPNLIEITLNEGRYHQIKRMLASTGNKVIGLHRTHAGNIELPCDLAEGAHRMLTEQEVKSI